MFRGLVLFLENLFLSAMSYSRQRALDESSARNAERFFKEDRPVSEYYSENVFDLPKMQKYLSPKAFEAVVAAVGQGRKIDRGVADEIAEGMRVWAMEKGATHYTHLFQPLNDSTAEKHESFVDFNNGKAMESFRGSALVQQEPDASSFPNGGLRNTFEARGYSAWDPTSPVFVLDGTLCVPSVFVAYTGEALDMKVPLLKSVQSLSKSASALASLFDPDVKSVNVNVGLEQEYFLVDEALYKARPDLVLCGRTVIGHTSAKDQQLGDHYFGAIPRRVEAFMKDFETEAYRLGIRLKTRHNEVAPNQFECAPQYSDVTTAIDQNMLLMIVMQKVAERHRLKVIFHEKPFDGVNGSGKHCNWSIQTDTGVNLLSPGKTPRETLRFLSFFASVVKGVYDHNYLLMASVASLNNSYRLGGTEAPPAVMSVFSGSTLTSVLGELVSMGNLPEGKLGKETMRVVNSMPEIVLDNTDRNRTSPFAFTGNRFEFRAVGSSQNAAAAIYVLNTIVSDSINTFCAEVKEKLGGGLSEEAAILETVKEFIVKAKDILFEGNGYSREWEEEAARRGLKSINDVTSAFKAFRDEKTVALFERENVLSRSELEARYEVFNETYVKKLQIEARVIGDICLNHIVPAAVNYRNRLLGSIKGAKEVFGDYEGLCKAELDSFQKISEYVNALHDDVAALVEARKVANRLDDFISKAEAYECTVKPIMDKVRFSADHLEMLVDDELWPLPKYRELLFL